MKWIGLIAVVLTGSLLLSGVDDFADFGDPKGPAHAGVGGFSVSRYYITETARDTGVPNLVTAVLGDYRGYDTMFETVVIFAAGIAIFAILRTFGDGPPDRRRKFLDPAVDGDMGDPRVEDADQVEGLHDVRAVLTGQREVGLEVLTTGQFPDPCRGLLVDAGRMTTDLQQREDE